MATTTTHSCRCGPHSCPSAVLVLLLLVLLLHHQMGPAPILLPRQHVLNDAQLLVHKVRRMPLHGSILLGRVPPDHLLRVVHSRRLLIVCCHRRCCLGLVLVTLRATAAACTAASTPTTANRGQGGRGPSSMVSLSTTTSAPAAVPAPSARAVRPLDANQAAHFSVWVGWVWVGCA